jgi:3-isopropylmalate/(R)-2-methylmalate dehydratase large subunit
MAQTLYDKLWDAHVVHQESEGTCLLYIDHHLVHEVTSPQAFEELALASRKPWRVGANLAVADHNVPTLNRAQGIMIRCHACRSTPWMRIAISTALRNFA